MVELWVHQASLGLLVNLAVRVPQALRVPHPQDNLQWDPKAKEDFQGLQEDVFVEPP